MPRPPHRHPHRSARPGLAVIVAFGLVVSGCSERTTGAALPELLEFDSADVELVAGVASVTLRNVGDRDLGPVQLAVATPGNSDGATVPGLRVRTAPAMIATLTTGGEIPIEISLDGEAEAPVGSYSARLTASTAEAAPALVELRFEVVSGGVGAVRVLRLDGPDATRRGDPVDLSIELLGANGLQVPDAQATFTVLPSSAGMVLGGAFVPYRPGSVRVVARAGTLSDTVAIEVSEREAQGRFEVRAQGIETRRFTSDLWVHGDHAYLGTWNARVGADSTYFGNTLYTWNVAGDPVRVDEDRIDARVVNDVKVRADGALAVITHEGSNDALNGFTVLDLSDPANPEPITRFTASLESGVHNVWIDGDVLYLVVDGSGGLRIVSIQDPADPRIIGSFYGGESFLHDVYVRDGLAFLSHWNAGLIVLDVGNGIAGGSPANPVEVSRVPNLGGQTHNAWYWPETGYVFVGEEDFSSEPGILHVIDFTDPRAPREVATHSVPGDTPHNVWLDEDTATLFVAWYGNGVRALDVSGRLLGDLGQQGREMGSITYAGTSPDCIGTTATCSWAPQLVGDRLFVSDLNHGLVELEWIRER